MKQSLRQILGVLKTEQGGKYREKSSNIGIGEVQRKID